MMNAAKHLLPTGIKEDLRTLQRALVQVTREALIRIPFRQATVEGRGIKVNLGCGPLGRSSWVNVDFSAQPGAIRHDLRDPLPFASGSVHRIHCEHVIEHLSMEHGQALLRECYRVLEPGGLLRLIAPDAEKYMRAYVADDRTFFKALANIGNPSRPFRTRAELVNQMFRMGGAHLFAYDAETLSLYARDAGFSRITSSCQHDTTITDVIDGEDEWRLLESVYLNCWK